MHLLLLSEFPGRVLRELRGNKKKKKQGKGRRNCQTQDSPVLEDLEKRGGRDEGSAAIRKEEEPPEDRRGEMG